MTKLELDADFDTRFDAANASDAVIGSDARALFEVRTKESSALGAPAHAPGVRQLVQRGEEIPSAAVEEPPSIA